MNAERYVELMTTKVLPAISDAYRGLARLLHIHMALALNIVIKVRWMPSLCHTKRGSATACGSTHEYGR